ncbi:MAG: AAA family ATPase [Bacteroidaceae bacterium]|nr:AAA family ATPase [Bacteroidaceae bacterium]
MKENINISSPEFQNALSLIKFTHQSVFLTGKAGTGKSTFLRYIRTEIKKKSVVLAPTGIAAINAEGSTLHSFFKLPFYPLLLDDPKFSVRRIRDFLKYKKSQIKLLKQVDLIIIDEISMVRADIIDFIDRILRVYCQNMREPFGGKQMLLIGDVFQLEPVVKSDEREILSKFYPNPYFFSAHVFQQMKLVSIELKKVFRQKDAGFIAALDHIRQNKITDLELKLLNTRYVEEGETVKQENEGLNIVLATRRDNVDYINQTELDKLPGNIVLMKGVVTGDFPESSLPTLLQLELKENAQIIFIKNDPDHRWVNGTLGTISSFNPENGSIEVITEDGEIVNVSEERWSNVRYTYNEKEKKIEEEELGTFTQYPIRLAWAITIHKSQGLTFQNVTIDFSGGTFAGGQAYVALSRCTSLNGITLKKRITRSDIFVRPEIIEFAGRFNDQQDLQRALMEAKADTEYQACAKAFDKGDMAACLEHFFIAIHTRYDIEKPTVKRLIRKKLNVFKSLLEQRDEMKRQLETQDERLKKYATEYYIMGNDCMTQAHAPKAAIANYTKALDLYPNYVDALVRRGVTYLDENQLNEALSDLNQAVQLSPRSFKANYNRGKVLMAKGLFEEAANSFVKATSLNTEHAQAHKLAGDAFAALGKEDTAALYWELAEQLRDKKKRR